MKTIPVEIPDGKRAEWVNGVLTLVDDMPQDITERIKTFEDACEWCKSNGREELVKEYLQADFYLNHEMSADLQAYCKLRIITAALNEGWEPSGEQPEELWSVLYDWSANQYCADWYRNIRPFPARLCFKSELLATYAIKQFRDIYTDYIGRKKGDEKRTNSNAKHG